MKHILYIVLILMCIVYPVSAADNSTAFEDITLGIFDDAESVLQKVVLAVVYLFALISVISIIVGWFMHKEKLFMRGVQGCGVIILGAIIYFIAIEGFNYIVDNYWG